MGIHCGEFKCEHGELALFVEVPEAERKNHLADIAEAYAVEVSDSIPGGCIIWGRYHGEWHCNVSARWIVSSFIRGSLKVWSDTETHDEGK